MMPPLIIFSKGDEVAAQALTQFSSGENIDSTLAFKKGKLSEHIKNLHTPIFFMGHTDDTRKTIGGMKPAELARNFANGINKDQRAQLQDLYLISCEAGLLPHPSLAKQLSSELSKLGFTNLKIHTISSASVKNAPAMYVEVVTRQGAWSQAAVGSIQAYAYTGDKHGARRKELDDLLTKLEETPKASRTREQNAQVAAARKEMTAMFKAGTSGVQSLMSPQENYAQLISEFNKPENTIQAANTKVPDIQATPKKPGFFDKLFNKKPLSTPPDTKPTNVVPTYKINIAKEKFIAAFDEMNTKLSYLKNQYSEHSPAYRAASDLIKSLEPIYDQAKATSKTPVPLALERWELDEVERAVDRASEELPQHRGLWGKILEFLGIKTKTDSEKKLTAITEIISDEIQDAKVKGPSP